jgi:hypothetical protein
LVIERPATPEDQRPYPGRSFADPSVDYVDAMLNFVAASAAPPRSAAAAEPDAVAEPGAVAAAESGAVAAPPALKVQKRALRQAAAESDTPGKAGGLMNWTASKAVVLLS